MAAKVIYLAGVPASGKSSIFREIREELFDGAREFRSGKCRGIEKGPYRMLGVFDGSSFEGTDGLSWTVIDDALRYISEQRRSAARVVIVVEGDRLFNERFMAEAGATLYIIDAAPAVLAARHAQRRDTQSKEWLRRQRAKVERIAAKYNAPRIRNHIEEDRRRIVAHLVQQARLYAELGING